MTYRIALLLLLGTPIGLFGQKPDSATVVRSADSLLQHALQLLEKGDEQEALRLHEPTRLLVLQCCGPQSVQYGQTCFIRGSALYRQEAWAESVQWLENARNIQAEILGKSHPDYLKSLHNLCKAYAAVKADTAADACFLELIQIRSENPGPRQADYVEALSDYAEWKEEKDQFEDAVHWYLLAAEQAKKGNYQNNGTYFRILKALGDLYKEMGEYGMAEPYYVAARELAVQLYGPTHSNYVKSLNNLARLYARTGRVAEAETNYAEALGILEKTNKKNTELYALLLNNQAVMYEINGDDKKALNNYLLAYDTYAQLPHKAARNAANTLANMGNIYVNLGKLDSAELYLHQARQMFEQISGNPNSHISLPAYLNLGHVQMLKGNYGEAERIFIEIKALHAEMTGKKSPDYGSALKSLGLLYMQTGQYQLAETQFKEALEVYAYSRGVESINYQRAQVHLARAYVHLQETEKAAEHFRASNLCIRKKMINSAKFCTEQELRNILAEYEWDLSEFQAFALTHPTPPVCVDWYNNTLLLNGFLLENDRLLAKALLEADTATQAIYEKWQGCHRRLAKRYARPIDDQKKILSVETEADGYEKILIRNLKSFQETRQIPTWEAIKNLLKEDEAAIEFLHFETPLPDNDTVTRTQYLALLIRGGRDAPQMIPLFDAAQLEALIPSSGERKADYAAAIYNSHNRGVQEPGAAKKSLYELIWRPLEAHLKDCPTIYFSPSGLLHRLNFSAIPTPDDAILADRYELIQLGSTRQLIKQAARPTHNHLAALYGGIRFEMDSAAIFTANAQLDPLALAVRGPASNDSLQQHERGGSVWNYLKWTEKEVKSLAAILTSAGLSPRLLTGFEATEESFRLLGTQKPSPRILHIATHGFFFPDRQKQQTVDTKAVGFKTSANPLVRSGLLLAGANHAWQTGKPFKKGMENGILTAFEISNLQLNQTELVVLSACETGLGDIAGNEGVFGLQRAFKIAGAQYLIMSLWQVPDFQTQELMTTFYTHWLTENKTIPQAFRMAQQEMREKYENPYFWAGFVLVQ